MSLNCCFIKSLVFGVYYYNMNMMQTTDLVSYAGGTGKLVHHILYLGSKKIAHSNKLIKILILYLLMIICTSKKFFCLPFIVCVCVSVCVSACVCFATPGSMQKQAAPLQQHATSGSMPLLVASLVPQPGTEPALPALGAQSLNNWTAREVLYFTIFN